jgi:23S rRNA (uracil1939-C5)-methyltransferase
MNRAEPPDVLDIETLALGGDAVARAGPPGGRRQAVFVPYAAPGDKVRVERWEERPTYARAWVQEVLAPSADRADPPCPYFFKPGAAPETVCGGCDWQHLRYEAQARAKRQLLIDAFQRIGRIARPAVEETRAAPEAWRYRNKVQVPFVSRGGGTLAGFYAPNTHRVVPFQDCLIQSEDSVRVIHAVREWADRHGIAVYDADTDQGWLRHLLVRTNSQGEALVALVTRTAAFPDAVAFAEFLTQHCPAVKSIFQNVNMKRGNVILGPEWRHLHGRRYLQETLLGLKFRLSPGSFFQVNHAMAETLYRQVEAFVDPAPDDSILELYAGVGAIAQLLARRARRVWGVEENPQAVADAVQSAQWNGLRNVRFIQGRCEAVLAQGRFNQRAGDVMNAVVLDPPRAGCDPAVLRRAFRLAPRRIVYVSCDPATLARDARYMATGGYHLKRAVPVDLFPQTAHVESVSLFERVAS